jgi:hypothetical protein
MGRHASTSYSARGQLTRSSCRGKKVAAHFQESAGNTSGNLQACIPAAAHVNSTCQLRHVTLLLHKCNTDMKNALHKLLMPRLLCTHDYMSDSQSDDCPLTSTCARTANRAASLAVWKARMKLQAATSRHRAQLKIHGTQRLYHGGCS